MSIGIFKLCGEVGTRAQFGRAPSYDSDASSNPAESIMSTTEILKAPTIDTQ